MVDEVKIGTSWRDDELDAIVADYFAMFAAEFSGQSYIKARHNAALTARIGRPHGSVEFKHQNISAVLDELGMPWIPGYKPRRNYQNVLFAAIDRYLSGHPEILEPAPSPSAVARSPGDIFVVPPLLTANGDRSPEGLLRLVRKFDPVERDHRNRSLGRAGEEFVMELEKRRLAEAGHADLARRVRWTAVEEGDGAGYDILSFDTTGRRQLLEVKTTNGSGRTPFFLTRNECAVAKQSPAEWLIYRVHFFATEPRIFTIAAPLDKAIHLRPETWRASF